MKIQRDESTRWKLATDGIKFPKDRKGSDYKLLDELRHKIRKKMLTGFDD